MTENNNAMHELGDGELNFRVAERVLGLWLEEEHGAFRDDDGRFRFFEEELPDFAGNHSECFGFVVGTMLEKGWHYECADTITGQHKASFGTGRVRGGKPFTVVADSLPRALCLAALNALEAGPPQKQQFPTPPSEGPSQP